MRMGRKRRPRRQNPQLNRISLRATGKLGCGPAVFPEQWGSKIPWIDAIPGCSARGGFHWIFPPRLAEGKIV
jgi:hypothetical protein